MAQTERDAGGTERGALADLERCAGNDREVHWQRRGGKPSVFNELLDSTVLSVF